jgi:hypothetical protein
VVPGIKIDTTIRRWCESCGKFTSSGLDPYGNEVCADKNHHDPGVDDDDDW